MKKIFLILMTAIILMGSLFTFQNFVKAQTQTNPSEYTVLAPLPGTTNGVCDPTKPDDPACKTTLEKYLPGVFKLAIGLATVFAVLMIVIGGFQYISTDAIMKKTEGKERIKNAVFGLVLVISAWLILYTINPNLLNLNLNITDATTSAPAGTLTVNGTVINLHTTDQLLDQKEASQILTNEGFTFSSSGKCTDRTNAKCTSVDQIHSDTVAGLISLKNTCGTSCGQLVMTGGTEDHTPCSNSTNCLSHASGFKADISNTAANGSNFTNYIGQLVQAQNNVTMTTNGFYNIKVGDYTYQVHPEGNHMDITVIPKK
jgi:hypothetical protein